MKNATDSDTQKNQRLIRKLDLVALTEMRFSACGFKPNSEAVRLCLHSKRHSSVRGRKAGVDFP